NIQEPVPVFLPASLRDREEHLLAQFFALEAPERRAEEGLVFRSPALADPEDDLFPDILGKICAPSVSPECLLRPRAVVLGEGEDGLFLDGTVIGPPQDRIQGLHCPI